jgi:trimeric autotransporter adhesin
MSTKTTFKRVALVAVAALGMGVMSSVAPASAATKTPTSVTVGTIPGASVGTVHTTPVTIAFPGVAAGSDTFTVSVRVTAAPAGSGYRNYNDTLATSGEVTPGTNVLAKVTVSLPTSNTGIFAIEASGASTSSVDGQTIAGTYTSSGVTGAAGSASFNINVTPDVAGTYSVLVSTRGSAGTTLTAATVPVYAAGDANASYSFATGVSPTTATLATVTGAATTGATVGRLMKVTLNTGAVLGAGETIRLSTNNTNATMGVVTNQLTGATSGYTATLDLDSSHFVGGVAYFKLADSTATATTTVVTATGTGLLSPSVTSTVSSTTVLLASAASITVNNGVSAVRPGSGKVGGTAGATFTDTSSISAASHTYGLTTATTTAAVTRMVVTDTSGDLTGIPGVTYETSVSTAATTGLGTVTFTGALATAGDSFTATIHSTTATATITVTSATATVTGTTGSATAEPASTIYATHGSSVVATVLVKDQFGAAFANSPVSVSVTGRNATTVATSLVTDATGRASFTLADAGTAATLLTQSVIVFDTALTANTNVTVNYGVDRVAKVALSTPTTLNTAATGISYTDIDASSAAGASATTTTITATVTDVNGAVLVGVPVTFTTASEGAGILSTTVTVYTGTAGTAAASVFGWTAGIKTFTATAGAQSATGTVNYRQGGGTSLAPTNSATEARTISAVANGNSIIVTAKDRFGNPVSGVPLWGTRTGNGTFGGGSNTNGQTTGVDGTAEFLFNAGSADSVVTITAGSATATPAPCYAQTGNLAGINACSTATTQTAYTASTVGTTTTAQTGVGASIAPAGVSSVTVAVPAGTDSAQTAADAAAEATDAANAATDAANAAAEAADAATAAAQDAADAVAALSTQVSEMVNALKKQITALTNLVIKIQKKVRA